MQWVPAFQLIKISFYEKLYNGSLILGGGHNSPKQVIFDIGSDKRDKNSVVVLQHAKKSPSLCSLPNRVVVNNTVYIFYEHLIWSFDNNN